MRHQVKVLEHEAFPACELTLYLLDNFAEVDAGRVRPLMLICPGGAYRFLSEREMEPVALRMNALGCHAAVLRYAVAPEHFPTQLLQLLYAIGYARRRADKWHVDGERIYVMGFSAGGHLAASAGVFWNKPFYAQKIGMDVEDVRPNALVLSYPVITTGAVSHAETVDNITGKNRIVWGDTLSLEKQVGPHTPPTFLWHTFEDAAVPAENSLLFAMALKKAGVPFSLHVFEKGGHGLSLSNREVYSDARQDQIRPECAKWVDLMYDFLSGR